jgi:hypothetical protein
MDTQELLRTELVNRLGHFGGDAPADACAAVVIHSLDLETFLTGTLEFAARVPLAMREPWRRAFTKTLFFAGDPAQLGAGHMAPDGEIGWYGPDRARRFDGIRRALRLFRGPSAVVGVPPVISLGGIGDYATLRIATPGMSIGDYLIHTSHLICEASLSGLLPVGHALHVEHVEVIDARAALTYPREQTLWRIAETERGSGELKLFAYLTGAHDAHR